MSEEIVSKDGNRELERECGYYQGLAEGRRGEIERLAAIITRGRADAGTIPTTQATPPGDCTAEFWRRKYEASRQDCEARKKANEELRTALAEAGGKVQDVQRLLVSANGENCKLSRTVDMQNDELKRLRENLEFAVLCLPGGGGATDGAWHVSGDNSEHVIAVYEMDADERVPRLIWSRNIEEHHKARVVVAKDLREALAKFDKGWKGAYNV